MSGLNRERIEGWEDSYLEISTRYADLTKRMSVLTDYAYLLVQSQLVAARDRLEITQQLWNASELLCAGTAVVTLADRDRRKLAAQQLLEAAARVEAACVSDTRRHPAVSKFLGHSSELSRDLEVVLNREISLGRDLADAKEEVGDSDKFRTLLEVQCPWLKWETAERLMYNAMDSPLAAKWDARREQIEAEIREIMDEERS